MRFSLRWLFGLVAFAALASASLVYASQPLTEILAAVLAFFLACAIIGAAYSHASSAAFCSGFAIAGWIYVLMLWIPLGRLNKGPPLPTEVVDRAISILYEGISQEVRAEPINGDLDGDTR